MQHFWTASLTLPDRPDWQEDTLTAEFFSLQHQLECPDLVAGVTIGPPWFCQEDTGLIDKWATECSTAVPLTSLSSMAPG